MEIIKRSNLSIRTTSIDDDEIPDWLLFEILLRLPLNSVFQSRVVSKRWLSVSSAPYFVRAYASRASSLSRPPWIVLPHSVWSYDKIIPKFVHNPSNNNVIPPELYLRPQPRERVTNGRFSIVGLSNGLMLHCSSTQKIRLDHCQFCICNPITGHRTEPVTFWVPNGVHLGWGFLSRVDQEFTLKSFRIVQAMHKPDNHTVIVFNVYYSEIGDWREFTANGPGPKKLELQRSAAALDGILYWADRGGYVIMYDPEAKPGQQVRHIRDPHDVMKPQYGMLYDYSCVAYRGELRYFGGYVCSHDGIPEFSIWKLEDLSSGKWLRVHKIEYRYVNSGVPGTGRALEIVCLDPFDSDVVYLSDGCARSVFSYNMKSGTLDDCREMVVDDGGTFTNRIDIFRYALVLVVPPWPKVVGEKHLERCSRG